MQILFTYYFTHFVLFVSILLRISVLSQFHNKFTIRSAKEDILICQRKKVFFLNHFSRNKLCTLERIAKQLHYNFRYCSRMSSKKKTLRLTCSLPANSKTSVWEYVLYASNHERMQWKIKKRFLWLDKWEYHLNRWKGFPMEP